MLHCCLLLLVFLLTPAFGVACVQVVCRVHLFAVAADSAVPSGSAAADGTADAKPDPDADPDDGEDALGALCNNLERALAAPDQPAVSGGGNIFV